MWSGTDFDMDIALQSLKYATRLLVAEHDPEQLAFKALDAVTDFGGSNRVMLLSLLDDGVTGLVIGAICDGQFTAPNDSIDLQTTGLWLTMQSKKPECFASSDAYPYPVPLLTEPTERRCYCFPLIGTQYRVIGFVCLQQEGVCQLAKYQNEMVVVLTTLIASSLENAKLFELATVDGLTGLYIRRYLDIRLQEEIARIRRAGGRLAILMTDIDHFKNFNDTYGHQQGDLVLQELAGLFRTTMRKDLDIPCRYGGEEYIVILPETDLEGAVVFAERLRRKCENFAFTGFSGPLHVTISGGIAAMDHDNPYTKEEFIRIADSKLYEAKHAGRNRIRF